MKRSIRPSLLPTCSSCTRCYLDAGFARWIPLQQQQTRGAKSVRSQPNTIPVQLLQDHHRTGRKGSYVPISAGQMRNRWFPKGIARYAIGQELKDIKLGKIRVQLDPDFVTISKHRAMLQAAEEAEAQEQAAIEAAKEAERRATRVEREVKAAVIEQAKIVVVKDTTPLNPQRSIDLLGVLLPSTLEFTRPVIRMVEPKKDEIPEEVRAIMGKAPEGPIGIYGSVSTADIATFVKDCVAYNDEAARITLSETDIRFVGVSALEEATKLKHLGEYDVEISVKGTDGKVRRKVLVTAQRDEVEDAAEGTTKD